MPVTASSVPDIIARRPEARPGAQIRVVTNDRCLGEPAVGAGAGGGQARTLLKYYR
ncbi:MAG: hypothetical protein U1E33_01670 [Rhodospirillales bacterium]